MKCDRCGREGATLHALVDYGESGGWVESAHLCSACSEEVAEFMRAKGSFKVDVRVPKIHNPVTGKDYPIREKSSKYKKGEVRGLWK